MPRAHPFRYVALRYFNVAGADPMRRTGQSTRGATHLIKVACEVACGKRPRFQMFGNDYDTPDGTCVRDFIHVSDLADAHVAALDHLVRGGDSQVINCGYGKGYSVRQVLDTLEAVTGRPLPTDIGPRRPGDAVSVYTTSDRLQSVLGWKPRLDDLTEIVRSAYEWERRMTA